MIHLKITDPVFLVGPMGAGKSMVGQQLAKHLDRDFFDTDNTIEANQGMTIAEIFTHQGEANFRLQEQSTLNHLAQQQSAIIATGGGIVLSSVNRKLLCSQGVTIYLTVDPEVALARCRAAGDTRPLLTACHSTEEWNQLLQKRLKYYEEVADLTYGSDNLKPDQLIEQITHDLENYWNK